MARLTTIAALCASLLGSSLAYADGPDPKVVKAQKNCSGDNLPSSAARLRVDANTGQTVGNTHFPSNTAVQIVLVNQNPFKYQYRTDISSAPLEESIAQGFFSQLLDSLGPAAAKGAGGGGAAAEAVPVGCDATDYNAAVAAAAAVSAAESTLDQELKAPSVAYKAYTDFLVATDTDSVKCPDVCTQAAALLPSLDILLNLDNLQKAEDPFSKAVQALSDAMKKFAGTPCASTDWAKGVQKSLDQWQSKSSQVAAILGAKSSFTSMKALINTVLESEYPFQRPYYPTLAGPATGVSVKIYRLNLRVATAKEENIASLTLQIGESVVSVSMGIGASNAADVSIGRVAALVPGSDGTTNTLGARLGFLSDSSGRWQFRPVVMTMLNARLPHGGGWWSAAPAAISTGTAFRIEGVTKGQIEWIPVALGWNLGNEHFLLMVGLHLSRIDTVLQQTTTDSTGASVSASGFLKIGDPIPAGLADPLPIGRAWAKGLLIGLTFRTQ